MSSEISSDLFDKNGRLYGSGNGAENGEHDFSDYEYNASRFDNNPPAEGSSSNEKRSYIDSRAFSQGALALLAMLLITEVITAYVEPKKNISSAAIASFVAPLSIELEFKLPAYASTNDPEEKKELAFTQKTAGLMFSQYVTLALVAIIILSTDLDEKCSPFGFRTIFSLTAFVERYLVAQPILHYFRASSDLTAVSLNEADRDDLENIGSSFSESDSSNGQKEKDTTQEPLISSSKQPPSSSHPLITKYLQLALFVVADLGLVFCATKDGGKFIEAIKIPLISGLNAMGVTDKSAITLFSGCLNMGLGATVLSYTGYRKDLRVNPVSRFLTMLLTVGPTQLAASYGLPTPSFMLSFAIAAIANIVIQLSGFGEKIDKLSFQFFGACKERFKANCLPAPTPTK